MALTKKQVENMFKEEYKKVLAGNDRVAKEQDWHAFVDVLSADGDITEEQADSWDVPPFIK